MKSNLYELDPERLATTDEQGNRVYLYPEDVKGKWKSRRTLVSWTLLLLYLVAPWFSVNGKPFFLINLSRNEFTFLGHTLYGVEPVLLFLLVASGLFFIAAVTSVFGRVWCGWACPQTVFIQTIFMKIETWIEGKSRARRALDKAPLSWNKFLRKSLKWFIFILVSLHIAHTFVGYFVGPHELLAISLHSPAENLGLFSATMIITAIILLDFGWFREQFCIIACPYGRMQSVMMDEHSLTVAYDQKRGEPRRGSGTPEGDCINCYHCVKVCPTGIDIRRGSQLECIGCTLCIDACDDIMEKVKKPSGLIRYSSEVELSGGKTSLLRPRSFLYAAVSLALVTGFFFSLKSSARLDLVFLRAKIPFQVTREGTVVNQFTLKVTHQGSKTYDLTFTVQDEILEDQVKIVMPISPMIIDRPSEKSVIAFKFAPSLLNQGSRKITVVATDQRTLLEVARKEVTLVGPVE